MYYLLKFLTVPGIQSYIYIAIFCERSWWRWRWCRHPGKQQARPAGIKSGQGQDLCSLDHQYEEGYLALNRLCRLPSEWIRLTTIDVWLMIFWQVRFALSSISSWRTVDGDFDYEAFWNNIVDFFEDVPGPVAQRRVDKLLEWWTRYWLCSGIVCVRHLTWLFRKVFGKNHREDLTPEVISKMSVTALAEQRKALEDAFFDSE